MINIKDKEFLKAFGKTIRAHRKAHDLSQEQLAYNSELTLSQIGRIERGETNPTICTIKVIADTLDLTLSEILKDPDDVSPRS